MHQLAEIDLLVEQTDGVSDLGRTSTQHFLKPAELKMRLLLLLLVRAPALALLSLLPVASATAQWGLSCRQEIPAELIRGLWSRHILLTSNLPRKEDIKLMNATLDVYMRIFSSILQHSHLQHNGRASSSALLKQLSPSDQKWVRLVLEEKKEEMEKLRRNLSRVRPDNEDMISQLSKIKVDDPMDQRKALAEFGLVYLAASRVAH
ncbi:uncharacterized protein LOC132998485 [Limanda limanda]|uniref:uncharacterized protein LOC132998485 n=1 Tax=Limanda limanda TaxID=27771 RepID=UPI0029C6AE82|nr:uncharacterized protein LOC132998485 [Limanda limanda]